ncbi:SseB family protein [Lysobacter fragariae]
MESQFVPSNDLETHLLNAQLGHIPESDFWDTLLPAKVVVLLDKDPGPGGVWDNSVSPLILSNADGSLVLAMFTAPERSTPWHKRVPQFAFGMAVPFQWLLQGIANNVGIVINPGYTVGLEMSPDAIAVLKSRLQPPPVAS